MLLDRCWGREAFCGTAGPLIEPFSGSGDRGGGPGGLLVVASELALSACGGWERFELLEGSGEFGGPRPVVLQP